MEKNREGGAAILDSEIIFSQGKLHQEDNVETRVRLEEVSKQVDKYSEEESSSRKNCRCKVLKVGVLVIRKKNKDASMTGIERSMGRVNEMGS